MSERLIIDETTIYEVDEGCLRQKENSGIKAFADQREDYKAYKSFDKLAKNKLTKK